MPRVYEMSFDPHQKRWTKMYRGKRYTIACSVLGVPPTKEASYKAANEWWRKKRAELDAARYSFEVDINNDNVINDIARKTIAALKTWLRDQAATPAPVPASAADDMMK